MVDLRFYNTMRDNKHVVRLAKHAGGVGLSENMTKYSVDEPVNRCTHTRIARTAHKLYGNQLVGRETEPR